MARRDNIEELKASLEKLGATHVLTYDELADKSVREKIKSWTQGKVRLPPLRRHDTERFQ